MKKYSNIDYTHRPKSYWEDGEVLAAVLRNVKGRERRDMISNLIEAISAKRLGLADVEPDIIGRSYEYLIHKFAEGSVSSAGEFYTPKEVGLLMARIMNPEAWPVSIPLQDPDLDPGYGQRPDVCFLRVLDRTDEEMTSALGLT